MWEKSVLGLWDAARLVRKAQPTVLDQNLTDASSAQLQ